MNTTSPSTPAAGETAIIYAAIELSSTNWLLAIQAPDHQKVSRHQMPAGDANQWVHATTADTHRNCPLDR